LLDASAILGGDEECRLEYIHMFEYGGLVGSVVGLFDRVAAQKHEARTSPLECCCFVVFLCDRHINDVVLAVGF
jgi:hypothetical protein